VRDNKAGKGILPFDHPQAGRALLGVTGTPPTGCKIFWARGRATLILGNGHRYSDFTTASKTAFQNPSVRFVNINMLFSEFEACKHRCFPGFQGEGPLPRSKKLQQGG